jgi:hypothetical protein
MCFSGISGSDAHGNEAMVLVASLSTVVGDGGSERDLCVGWFLCLFAVRYGEDEEAEEPAKVQSDRIVYQVASLVCVLIATDNLLRWLERGGNSNWFWLCSGSVAMVVLFGTLALVAQFFYSAEIVKGLNDQLVEGSGHRDID